MLDLPDVVGPNPPERGGTRSGGRETSVPPPSARLTGTRSVGVASNDDRVVGGPAFGDSSAGFASRRSVPDPWTKTLTAMLIMMIGLLMLRFVLPPILEHGRYAWQRGQLRAEYDTAGERLTDVALGSLGTASRLVSQRVGPSVVHIDVAAVVSLDSASARFFAGGSAGPLVTPEQGSGVIVDSSGYILTNEHVIADASDIAVTLSDGRSLPAQLVGSDRLTDLALLKIEADGLLPVEWADSDESQVGDPVWAVGSPFGLDRTVTFGILSGKHRIVGSRREGTGRDRGGSAFQDFMQSDVAVNPGNSGGPLVNDQGQLIGINTAIVGKLYSGVSFSIPSNVARSVYERLRAMGRVERGWLGVLLATDTETPEELRGQGVLVADFATEDSPAARAGIRQGDQIVQFNGLAVSSRDDLMRRIADAAAGSEVKLLLRRRGRLFELPVMLGTRPIEQAYRLPPRQP